MGRRVDCDVLVIGSGPGGATTACLLAEAGRDVVLVEEGANLPLSSAESYSLEEMNQKYRNGGLTPAFGDDTVTYLEGRCVGGASEINAALYHPPRPDTLTEWAARYQLDDFGPAEMASRFQAVEEEMGVSVARDGIGPAAGLLKAGAEELGWQVGEVKRFWRYSQKSDGSWVGRRQSVTETLVPRFLAAGGRLMADTWVRRLVLERGRAVAAEALSSRESGRTERIAFHFKDVVVAAGAIQSPLILRRSGLTHMIGDSLRIHPMLRVAARFDHEANDPAFGVPVQQVERFKPHITLGCSHSSLPHLALWLAGDVEDKARKLEEWRNMAIFYVLVSGTGLGRVRNMPVFDEPFVRHPITDRDLALLGEGTYRLGQLLFAAGAREIFGPIEGAPPTRNLDQLAALRHSLPHGGMNVTAIHLFSTCPMGGDPRSSAVDGFGRLHGYANVYVNDVSILPGTPGVNPQGTVMAVARRNVEHFLGA